MVRVKKSAYKMKGSPMQRNFPSAFKAVDPPSDKDELVKHEYEADSIEASGHGYKSSESKTVLISKGTQRLIDARAPKDIIEKSKLRDIEKFKKNNLGKEKNLGN
tara:strand:+ start:225 stop:539 length:315 start_codon:yes stop_codon:yes gene_type:complete